MQKIAVAGRALRVQLEIPHAPVAQQNQLDVLPADIDDHLRIGKIMQRRLRVRDGLHQRHVRAQHLAENVLGVAGRAHAENLQPRAAIHFHLSAQIAKHLNRVRNRIALGEPIGLGQHLAARRQQHGLGGGGAAVQADEGFHLLAALKVAGMNGAGW